MKRIKQIDADLIFMILSADIRQIRLISVLFLFCIV